MKQAGYAPDVIIAHPAWGESLFLKDVWPKAKLGIYCEFFYHEQGADVGFDPEFEQHDDASACRLRLKNLNYMLHFDRADAGVSPTQWQASQFPESFRGRISVIHDGIDTDAVAPRPDVKLTLPDGVVLTRADEVVTFVNRNLEPYRGYHIFMRALPKLLRARPALRVLIVGGDGVSYGARPPAGSRGGTCSLRRYVRKFPGTTGRACILRVTCPMSISSRCCSYPRCMCTSPIRSYCPGACSRP